MTDNERIHAIMARRTSVYAIDGVKAMFADIDFLLQQLGQGVTDTRTYTMDFREYCKLLEDSTIMREALQIALEHWEMYKEFFVDVEQEAFDAVSSVLSSLEAMEK